MMKMKSDKVSIVHSQGFSQLVNPSIPTSYPALVELGSLTLIHIWLLLEFESKEIGMLTAKSLF